MKFLEGFRAIDLTTPIAGHCARILASYGVAVTHIDSSDTKLTSLQQKIAWRTARHDQQCIALDIRDDAGRAQFLKLVAESDFIIESFTPGELAKLGLDYASLAKINPRIIVTSISTFGQQGPYAHYKGGELIASAMAGILFATGDSDRAPVKEALDANYFHGCAAAALGTVIAHYERQRSGLGQHVDLSVQEAGVSRNTNNILLWQFDKRTVSRGGAFLRFGRATIRCIWKLQDGYAFWSMATGRFGAPANRALCAWMNELGYDNPMNGVDWDKYDRATLDAEIRKVWEAALTRFFGDRTRAEIGTEGMRRGINAAPAGEPSDLLGHPQLKSRELFVTTPWPGSSQSVSQTVSMPRYFLRTGSEETTVLPLTVGPA
jgi:crotonobetainyl-CoA:carnitine CoA-transferase CaiB-like acyl-CoA transferase